jgi:AraC family transcriptional regulator
MGAVDKSQKAFGARTLALAPWQERKVLRYVEEHLGQPIRTPELASLVGLGVSQFSRRFRGSFGLPPRAYMIRTRLDRAKAMMRQSRATLCEIALDSGFCDQAHMSRLFHAFVGETPRRWRRDNRLAI